MLSTATGPTESPRRGRFRCVERAEYHVIGIIVGIRTTIDKAGRLVVPRVLRDRIGLLGGGEVEIDLDGAAIRIEPVGARGLRQDSDRILIPATGTQLTSAGVREMVDADWYNR